jgi:hypothetical protein
VQDHVCKTYDGVPIKLGLRVVDYDNRVGTVVAEPWEFTRGVELGLPVEAGCWSGPGSRGHWWGVCPDRPGHAHELGKCRGAGDFDGSRLTTRGAGK